MKIALQHTVFNNGRHYGRYALIIECAGVILFKRVIKDGDILRCDLFAELSCKQGKPLLNGICAEHAGECLEKIRRRIVPDENAVFSGIHGPCIEAHESIVNAFLYHGTAVEQILAETESIGFIFVLALTEYGSDYRVGEVITAFCVKPEGVADMGMGSAC